MYDLRMKYYINLYHCGKLNYMNIT